MLKTPLVSVIYVNYNTTDLLIESIRSLQQNCNTVPYEIIIVDNASKPEGIERLSALVEHTGIRLILSAQNQGFGKANNLGSSYAEGDFLFFLNPDTLVVNDVIEIFFKFMESSPQGVAACGGRLLKDDFTPNDSYGNFPGILLELCNVGLGLRFFFNDHYKKNVAIAAEVYTEDKFQVPYIVGADIFIRRERFLEVDGFDETFFMYYEETDLFYKLSKKGYSAYILPEAQIIHFEGASIGESKRNFNERKFHHLLHSKLKYYRKWCHEPKLSLLKMVIAIQLLVQFAKGNLGRDYKFIVNEYLKAIRRQGAGPGVLKTS
jgi:GT2 family glycosyltransferase